MDANNQPVYISIASYYRKLILTGKLKPGDALPSVREVALMEKINPNTAARAFSILVQEGLVTSIEKKGYYVQNGSTDRREGLLHSLRDLLSQGYSKQEIAEALNEMEGIHD
ncbi:MAG: GntR family transcriptional regulator [Bacilli bacterium]|nr:GntR family transcriptional regulator [Bacilli bacterium]